MYFPISIFFNTKKVLHVPIFLRSKSNWTLTSGEIKGTEYVQGSRLLFTGMLQCNEALLSTKSENGSVQPLKSSRPRSRGNRDENSSAAFSYYNIEKILCFIVIGLLARQEDMMFTRKKAKKGPLRNDRKRPAAVEKGLSDSDC